MKKFSLLKNQKFISVLLILGLMFAPAAFCTEETEITPNGVSQGALVNALKTLQTQVNILIANSNLLKNARLVETYGSLLTTPSLLTGSTNTKIKTQAITNYKINGVLYAKAATDDVCDLTGVAALTTGYKKIKLSLGSAGTCTVTPSAEAATLNAVVIPATPTDEVLIGGLTIGDGAAHDFAAAAVTADGGVIVPASYFDNALTAAVAVGTGTATDPSVSLAD
jgi:hypothetical protein